MKISLAMLLCVVTVAVMKTSTVQGQFNIANVQAAGLILDETKAQLMKKEGVFLRTYFNHGCVAAGCCNAFFWQVRMKEKCAMAGWFKWFFNGPFLVNHKPVLNKCLDCLKGEPNCRIGTQWCTGDRNQQWHFDFKKNRTTEHGDALFTIHNSKFPNQCATIDLEDKNKLVLSDCEPDSRKEQLFYVSRDWFQAAMEQSDQGTSE